MYKLTLIVALYNVKEYVIDCINSFIDAKPAEHSIRLVIVNDGSTDNSRELIKSFEGYSNISILDKENGGLSSARNTGLDYALGSSEYVAFLDADDLITADYFNEFDHIYKQCKPDLIEFNVNYFSNWRTVKLNVSHGDNKLIDINDDVFERVVSNGMWYACARIYKACLFDQLRFADGRRYEDIILVPSLYSQSKNIYSSSKVLYLYRDNSNGITRNGKVSDVDDVLYAVKVFELLNIKSNVQACFKHNAFNAVMPILAHIPYDKNHAKLVIDIATGMNKSIFEVWCTYFKLKCLIPVKIVVKYFITKRSNKT